MRKRIKKNEPIVGFAAFGSGHVEAKNPHFVGQVTSWDPTTGEIEIVEHGNENEIVSGVLEKTIQLRKSQFVLLQFKEADIHSLLKIKDVADTPKWKVNVVYPPTLSECVKFTNYSFFPINRKKRNKKHHRQEEKAVLA